MQPTEEKWLPVLGYEGLYEVSDHGRFRRFGRIRKLHMGAQGYLLIELYKNGGSKSHAVHVIVARTFLGERPAGADVCHNDGSRTNNALTNLRYDTRAGNFADKRRHGTRVSGEQSRLAKLTQVSVDDIRARRAQGVRVADLARVHGVCESNVYRILRNETWS